MAGRVTQLVVEAVIAATDANVRVTQIAVEAVIAPTSQNLVVSQTGLEVARTGDPTLLVSQAGFEVAYELPKGTFNLGAVIRAEVSSSFAANTVIETPGISSSFNAEALFLRTFSFGRWIEGGWADPVLYENTGLTADAWKELGFLVNAYIGVMPFFTADATILATLTFGSKADAVLFAEMSGSFAANAVSRWTVVSAWTLDATIRKVTTATFLADAIRLKGISGSLATKAVLHATLVSSFSLDAIKATWFTLDAFIPISVNAWIDLGFFANAIIKRTMGVPGILPLSYPGISRTLYGHTVNALTPLFPVGPDELMMVRVVTPPSDGGDLGAFNATRTLNYGVTASPGDYWFSVIPGEYYIYSSKNNVYRPGLTGSGTYANWGASSLSIAVDAFVQPVFRVDANFVWTFTFPVAFDATLRKTMPASFSAGAFIQPFMLVDAEIVPLHFTVGAWIKCEFTLNAWLIRRVVSSFPVNAFVRPAFRVNAIRRKVQTGTFAVSSWFTNPRYGNFNVGSWILLHFEIGASIRLTKYRRFTAGAWLLKHITTSTTTDAFVQPYMRLDAVLYRPEFHVDAIRLETFGGSFTVEANFVWTWASGVPTDAYIQPYFRVDAVRHEEIVTSFALSSWSIIRVFGSFTLQAGITGFLTDAVIKRNQQFLFSIFALKSVIHWSKAFLVQAEKRDPGAYWDPYTETWLHQHFLVDASISIPRPSFFSVAAALTTSGLVIRSTTVDAHIRNYEVPGEFLLEADISTLRTVVYEGAGEVVVEHHLINERLSYPGIPSPLRGNDNTVYGPFWPPDLAPVTITLWDFPAGNIGIYSVNEDKSAAPARTVIFWPSYSNEPHYVYSWTTGVYSPTLTGSGMVSYYRDDAVVVSLPAPTIDAWLVGTAGEPFTLDAEIVGSEKLRAFAVAADVAAVGEQRGIFEVGAHLLAPRPGFFSASAEIAAHAFMVDAVIHQPNISVDAFIQPCFVVNAIRFEGFAWAFTVNAATYLPVTTSSFAVDSDICLEGDIRGAMVLEALVLGTRTKRFYLAALSIPDVSFTVNSYIGQFATVDAWIGSLGGGMGSFPVGAYVRGSSIIIFPDDGSSPTNPTGGSPTINRSFRVKIEAFIPDEIPIGNDAEIERLISLILEAEAELDALYCAVDNYGSQGYPVAGGSSYGGGYTGTLPNTISQIGYPGAGDIDDCWVVATVWAAVASGQSFQPTVTQYRAWSQNPDRPGPTGGSLDHIMRGARGAWPGANIRRYASTDWNGFISLLKGGWTASLAVRSSALPSNLRFGFNGLHQIGVAYSNGTYYVANPLAPSGSSPLAISGFDLRTAARGFTGGTICACMFG